MKGVVNQSGLDSEELGDGLFSEWINDYKFVAYKTGSNKSACLIRRALDEASDID